MANDVSEKKNKEVGFKIIRYVQDYETGSLILRTPGLFGSTSVSILCLLFRKRAVSNCNR